MTPRRARGSTVAQRRIALRLGTALRLVAALVVAAPATAALAQDVTGLSRQLVEVEADAEQLLRQPVRRGPRRSATFVEERLTDGELFYRLQDYVRASIILSDIIENYPNHRAYPDALFLLSESLFRAGDYFGARHRFRQLIQHSEESAYRPFTQRALGRLIEIAIHTQDFDGVEDYFIILSRLPPGEVEATTTYYRAKYLYSRAVPPEEAVTEAAIGDRAELPTVDASLLEQARRAFEGVAAGSPYYLQARYFVGVIYTLGERYPQAIEAFRRVLGGSAESEDERQVLELARLALGRLYYETADLEQAIQAYQSLPRTSANFHVALYELAWVYIRMGDSLRAERALEVLSVAAPESRFIPDGKLLRANLLLRNGRYEASQQVFREVAREFGPVRRELDQMIAARPDPPAYFRALVRENMENFDANAFLPPLAQRWTSSSRDVDRALEVLGDLSQARRLVRETDQTIRRLQAALEQPNRVAVFPDLRRRAERAAGIRNRLARVRRGVMRSFEAQRPSVDADLADLRRRRHALERSMGDMPGTEEEFEAFDGEMLTRYRRLERETRRLEVELQGIEARVVATDRYLTDTEEGRDPSGVEAVRRELAGHRSSVLAFREQLENTRIALEASRLQVGPGDARHQRHRRLRQEQAALARQEVERLGGGSNLASLVVRIDQLESRLDEHDQEIERVVVERTRSMQNELASEGVRVRGYQAALQALEQDTEDVVGGVTYDNYRRVQNRFYNLVLRADVGRVDVAWGRREEHRQRVEMLTRERAREMRALDDEFREIADESSEGVGAEEGDGAGAGERGASL